jgi:hypothetical protein
LDTRCKDFVHDLLVLGAVEFLQEQLALRIGQQSRGHVLEARYAEGGLVEVLGEGLGAELAFGLEAPEFGEGALEGAMGVAAGAVDSLLGLGRGGVHHGIERSGQASGDGGTTAHPPSGVDDLGGQGLLDWALRFKVCLETGAEFGLLRLFIRQHEVAAGEES